MPKCEFCMDEDGNPNLINRAAGSSMGYCKVHKCARRINDSCSQGEIEQADEWGEPLHTKPK